MKSFSKFVKNDTGTVKKESGTPDIDCNLLITDLFLSNFANVLSVDNATENLIDQQISLFIRSALGC